jgi:hypothetical protein
VISLLGGQQVSDNFIPILDIIGDALDVLLLIVVGDLNVSPIGLQVNCLDLSKALIFCGECRLYDTRDIVLPARWSVIFGTVSRIVDSQSPGQGPVEISIYTFHVCKSNPFPQDHLVESADEECIKKASVEDGQTNHSADEFEVI